MGSADPYVMSYELSYAQNTITFKTDIYLDGEKLDCPVITREATSPNNESLPTCDELLEELQSNGNTEDAAGIQCTGQYSFIARYESGERPSS